MSEKVKITVVGDIATPSDRPVLGTSRLVPMLPFGMPGARGKLFPCLWQSPYVVFDDDLKENVRICLLLIAEGPPRPEIVAIRIPSEAIAKFPTAPINW